MYKIKILGIGVVATLLLTSFVMAETQTKINEKGSETANCSQQPPAVQWSKTFGGPEFDGLNFVEQTVDGGYIAYGLSEESDVCYMWLLKLDANGNEEWSVINHDLYGTDPPSGVYGFNALQTRDGGYLLSGRTLWNLSGLVVWVGFVWKTDAIGNTEWLEPFGEIDEYGVAFSTYPCDMIEIDDGYILAGVIGYDREVSDNAGDAMLTKIDLTGRLKWQKIYRVGDSYDSAWAICPTDDGGYLLTGDTESDDSDFWMIKTDASGNMEWEKFFGGEGIYCWSYVRNCYQTSDGGYIMAGCSVELGYSGTNDLWIVKTDAAGNIEWNETYGIKGSDACWCMEATNDGGYIFCVTRNYRGMQQPKDDVWIIKTDSSGNAVWSLIYGESAKTEVGRYISKTSDGGYIAAGMTGYWGGTNSDGLIIKIGPDQEMETPEMTVRKPRAGWIYLFDLIGFPFPLTQNALVIGDLTFAAECSDGSVIEKVEFFIDGTVIETVTEGPYTCDWTDAERGACKLKIRAYNMYGGTCKEEVDIQKIF